MESFTLLMNREIQYNKDMSSLKTMLYGLKARDLWGSNLYTVQ